MKLLYFRCLSYFVITLMVTLSYLPSFSGGFLLDDNFLIKDNPFIKASHSLVSYFNQEDGVVPGKSWSSGHTGYYRPLVNFTYRLDYLIWGVNPKGYRVTNIILHLTACLMAYHLFFLLVKDRFAAFWATCLFALHPVNTETVSWISSRNNILVTLFSSACLFAFARYREDRTPWKLTVSVLFFALAVFSKEFGLMVLPCLFLYQRWVSEKARDSREIAALIPYLLIVIGYFFLRKITIGSWITPTAPAEWFERIYFIPYLFMWSLRLILIPFGLHSFIVRYPDHYFHGPAVVSILSLVGLSFIVWKMVKNPLDRFAVISFVVSLVPIFNIFSTSAVTLVSMRWLYFPMIFGALLFARMIGGALKSNLPFSLTILIIAAAYLGTYSYLLNRYLWHDEDTFFSFEVRQFDNAFYYGGLAENLFNRKDYTEAETYFMKAIESFPRISRNYINYSALLIADNRAEDALKMLNGVRDLSMTKAERVGWYNNLGAAYFRLKDYHRAVAQIEKAIAIDPDETYLLVNIGAGYARAGDYDRSISAFKKGLEKTPESVVIKKNLAVVYLRMGKFEDAISILESIPREAWRLNGIGPLHDNARKRLVSQKVRTGKSESTGPARNMTVTIQESRFGGQ